MRCYILLNYELDTNINDWYCYWFNMGLYNWKDRQIILLYITLSI